MSFPSLPRAAHLRHHARLSEPTPGARLEAAGVGPVGEVVGAWRSGGFVVLTVHSPNLVRAVPVAGTVPVVRAVQPLPNAGFVLLHEPWPGPVSRGRGNAAVVDAHGSITTRAEIGVFVGEMHASTDGDIWVGDSDMGIFSTGPNEPIRGHGLMKLSAGLDVLWRFPNRADLALIDDCGSLNLVGDTIWTCPYARYHLVRVDGESVRVWHTAGPRANIAAVLVSGEHEPDTVALVGAGWSRNAGPTAVGRLGTDDVEHQDNRVLRLPGGRLPAHPVALVGRGPDLHVLVGLDWYRISLDDLTTRSPSTSR